MTAAHRGGRYIRAHQSSPAAPSGQREIHGHSRQSQTQPGDGCHVPVRRQHPLLHAGQSRDADHRSAPASAAGLQNQPIRPDPSSGEQAAEPRRPGELAAAQLTAAFGGLDRPVREVIANCRHRQRGQRRAQLRPLNPDQRRKDGVETCDVGERPDSRDIQPDRQQDRRSQRGAARRRQSCANRPGGHPEGRPVWSHPATGRTAVAVAAGTQRAADPRTGSTGHRLDNLAVEHVALNGGALCELAGVGA